MSEALSQSLRDLVGHEQHLDHTAQVIENYVRRLAPPVVGAFQISCSDESEKEQVSTFHRRVARKFLPDLKATSRTAFRSANLGARYESGAASIAESHYATQASKDDYKLMIVKINSHVGIIERAGQRTYGHMERYDHESTSCGALGALLAGNQLPFACEIREAFEMDGLDRIGMLLDEERIAPTHRALFASVCQSGLQTRKLLEDLRGHPPLSPTLYLVIHGVTLNQSGPDAELICGVTTVDTRVDPWLQEQATVGDDPSRFTLGEDARRITIRA